MKKERTEYWPCDDGGAKSDLCRPRAIRLNYILTRNDIEILKNDINIEL